MTLVAALVMALTITAFVLAGIFGFGFFSLLRERERMRERTADQMVEAEVRLTNEVRDHMARRLTLQTEFDLRLTQREEQQREMFVKVIEQQAKTHQIAVEQLMNLVNFGASTRQQAVVSEREPDAETRTARLVTEETIERAKASLKQEYASRSIPVTDDELDAEARAFVMGERWSPPASLIGILDR